MRRTELKATRSFQAELSETPVAEPTPKPAGGLAHAPAGSARNDAAREDFGSG